MPPPDNGFTLVAEACHAGRRIDATVAELLPDISRSLAGDLVKRGLIRVCGEIRKPGYRLKAGDEIAGILPPPEPAAHAPEPMALDILHEDAHLIVLNKAPGVVVHPAPGHAGGTLVNGLLHHCADLSGIGGEIRPGIVHRLDKDTSGTLVVAKNDAAHLSLSEQFKNRAVDKRYLALVYGVPAADSGDIDLAVGRHPVDRKRMAAGPARGREAHTHWQVRQRYNGAALLELTLHTGRTHQIRVHCAAMGHPIIGDPLYCRRNPAQYFSKAVADHVKGVHRQMLHAWRLSIAHPADGRRMTFESPMPEDMAGVMGVLKKIPLKI